MPNSEKPPKVRPQILAQSVETARQVVAEKYGDALANSLGDGDLVDLALQILMEARAKDSP